MGDPTQTEPNHARSLTAPQRSSTGTHSRALLSPSAASVNHQRRFGRQVPGWETRYGTHGQGLTPGGPQGTILGYLFHRMYYHVTVFATSKQKGTSNLHSYDNTTTTHT
ncbi:Hypothetical predicted protein [Pelobates cultripes]|uniref:Uncharacterized protein n=1 Tax=Pelobates cultripes TaxID=61616 RepID=A0AAD1REY5_PELCU|nr:Hypothetical predicted protein [Pelobates cultripes]